MAGEVDVPAVGRVQSRWVWVFAASGAGIVGYAWWRRRSSAASAVPTVDPATGTNSTNPTYTNPAPHSTPDASGAKLAPANDQEWTGRVMADLTWMEPGYLAELLGKYLARQPLSLAEAAVVRSAWAVESKPPGGQPIILSTTGPTPGDGAGTATPPPPPAPAITELTRQHVVVSWPPVPTADRYDTWFSGPHGSTGKYANNAATFTYDFGMLHMAPGEKFTVSVASRAGGVVGTPASVDGTVPN